MINLPLNINNFSFLDKLKICKFILNDKNRWTQGNQVKNFEKKFSEYAGSKYAVFVSSGSTANELIAQYVKDTCGSRNIVVLPSTTWQTSCSPWIKNGFKPHFIDISLEDFSIDKQKLLSFVKSFKDEIACIFPTSLIGFTPDMDFYKMLESEYGVKIMFDNCENTFGKYENKNISSFFTSSTSTYFGHQIQSVEGGFIFTNSEDEYKYFLINRNHGMVRSLDAYNLKAENFENKLVDPLFDFYSLGSNYRNTDLNAFIGQLDFERVDVYEKSRDKFYSILKSKLNKSKFLLPEGRIKSKDCAFCFPIIFKDSNDRNLDMAKRLCNELGIEYRPIISGFLGYQTCYKKYFDSSINYKNSLKLHHDGFYIGLYHKMDLNLAKKFIKQLNKI